VNSRRPSCPPEYANINIPGDYKHDNSTGDPKSMPFIRARYDKTTGHSPNNPRQQVREQSCFKYITEITDMTKKYWQNHRGQSVYNKFEKIKI
jgi:hypothetical protein